MRRRGDEVSASRGRFSRQFLPAPGDSPEWQAAAAAAGSRQEFVGQSCDRIHEWRHLHMKLQASLEV